MKKLRSAVILLAATLLTVAASSAVAARPGSATCAGGTIAPGTYSSLKVTGVCSFGGGTVSVTHNLVVAAGASLNDHAASPLTTVHVGGNVLVGKGAILGLGTYNPAAPHDSVVGGNVIANHPLSLYISFTTIHGSLISHGGGGGVTGEFRNYPTKDNTIDGNAVIMGWTGGWIGFIRNHVGGNVIFSRNKSVINGLVDPPVPGQVDADSSEVMTNVIGRNLICQGNTPKAQVNPDDGGRPNTVGGHKIGQCANL
jgi:hypothetical protein